MPTFSPRVFSVLVALACFLPLDPISATGGVGQRPGATLLIPYFEVDVVRPDGPDTLFSVNNADPSPALARIVLWTDHGLSTLAFDLYLEAHATESLSLRRILMDGFLPATGGAETPLWFPGCGTTLATPALDGTALTELRARHRGQPSPADGFCHGAAREDTLAVGYITVDAVRDCSDSSGFDNSVLDHRNVLWGDVTLLDSSSNSAQAFAAVALRHQDQDELPTFWQDVSGGVDGRTAVGERTRTRFMNGGAFSGGTDLVIWNQGSGEAVPFVCGETTAGVELHLQFANEAGQILDERVETEQRRTARRQLGDDPPTPSRFGFVEVHADREAPLAAPSRENIQVLALPLLEAEDRFSVGLPSMEILDSGAGQAGSPPETSPAFTTDFASLFEVDPANGTYREVYRFNDDFGFYFIDIAVDGDRLFGIAATPIESRLFLSLDLITGQYEIKEDLGIEGGSVTFGPQGDLWFRGPDGLLQIDPNSGDTIQTLPLDNDVHGVMADAEDLFGWKFDGNVYTLVRIDMVTGKAEPWVSLELEDRFQLRNSDFDPTGNLWLIGDTDQEPSFQQYYRVALDRPSHLVRAELTAQEVIGFRSPRPIFRSLSFARAALHRLRAGGARPAATLLVPYFEVDLDNSEGRNTLFSVHNAAEQPVLANVVLWTDWGIPSVTFPLYLEAGAGRVFDLRRLFADGKPPALAAAAAELYSACATFAGPATVDPPDLAARHTGRPHTADGLCHGSSRGDALAVGFITVDVVRDCSADILSPADDGYFSVMDVAQGLAGDDNVLWGEVFLVDTSSDSAQGFAAVPVPADVKFEVGSPSFYSRSDNRLPLGCESRTRYFASSVFDGGTELLVWSAHSPVGGEPGVCGKMTRNSCPIQLELTSRDEAGGNVAESKELFVDRQTMRLAIGTDMLPLAGRFGSLDVQTRMKIDCELFTSFENVQNRVVPLMSARGRFSVALEATDLGGICN